MKIEDLLELKLKEIINYCDSRVLCTNNMDDHCPFIFACNGNDNKLVFFEIKERIKGNKGKIVKIIKKKTIKDRLNAI